MVKPLLSSSVRSWERKQLLLVLLRWAFYRLQDSVCLLSPCDRKETGTANKDNNNNFYLEMELLLLWLLVKFFPKGKRHLFSLCLWEEQSANKPSLVCLLCWLLRNVKRELVRIHLAAIWTVVEKLMKSSPQFLSCISSMLKPNRISQFIKSGPFQEGALKEETSRVWIRSYGCH